MNCSEQSALVLINLTDSQLEIDTPFKWWLVWRHSSSKANDSYL